MSAILFVVLCVLQMCDGYSTKSLIDAGVASEANPLMSLFIKHLGTFAGLAVPKAVLLALACTFLLPFPWLLGAVCAVYVVVVANNFRLMRKLM